MFTIIDDINYEMDTIVISDIQYDHVLLTNNIYNIMKDKTINIKKVKKSPLDLNKVRAHCFDICTDNDVSEMINLLFNKEDIATITSVDKIFINSYYRRILRARVEQNYIGKELLSGLVITTCSNYKMDAIIVEILMVLRIVCKFLGILSTIHDTIFPLEKLYMPLFWESVASRFIYLFGEKRIKEYSTETPKYDQQMRLLTILDTIFNIWSGTRLVLDNNVVKVVPATYVCRLICKLK